MSDDKTLKIRLTKAEKNPQTALEKGWFEDPQFCLGFFDRCEDHALVLAPERLDLALKAVELVAAQGDRHLANRAEGVLVHAFVSRRDLYWAGRTLEGYREKALECCPHCCSELFRREGDLFGEQRKARESLQALNRAIDEGRDVLTADDMGRIRYSRAVGYHFDGQRGRALDDAGRALLEISLDSPRGYFLDLLACMVVFIGGGDPCHDTVALGWYEQLEQRIKGRKNWRDVRTRIYWGRGHLHGRLGHQRLARDNMEGSFRRLLVDGLEREAVAAALDVGQLRCQPDLLRDSGVEKAEQVITRCLELRSDLTADHRSGLNEILRVLRRCPESAFAEMGSLRRSFIAPLPGRLEERLGNRVRRLSGRSARR